MGTGLEEKREGQKGKEGIMGITLPEPGKDQTKHQRGENLFTPTELRILEVLRDGRPKTKKEVMDSIDGEFTSASTYHKHIQRLREKLLMRGETILHVCIARWTIRVQWVRLLPLDGE